MALVKIMALVSHREHFFIGQSHVPITATVGPSQKISPMLLNEVELVTDGAILSSSFGIKFMTTIVKL